MYGELKLECQTYPGSLGSSRMCRCLSTTNQNQFRMYDWRCPKIESCMVRLYVIQKNNAIHLHFILFFIYFFFSFVFRYHLGCQVKQENEKVPHNNKLQKCNDKTEDFSKSHKSNGSDGQPRCLVGMCSETSHSQQPKLYIIRNTK